MSDDALSPAHPERQVGPMLLDGFDAVWARVRGRLDGLTQEEYLWEPVPGCWSVRCGEDGEWQVERPEPEPEPPPVTTIAWRLWHIGSECLAGYTANGLGPWPLEVTGRQWYAGAADALAALDRAWAAFRDGIGRLGEDGMWRPLGPDWGPYGSEPWAALVLHAVDEVSHHGAEVGLLRDLHAHRTD